MYFEITIQFTASAHDVYELIIDEKKHQEFAKNYVKIDRRIGGECNWYNSMFGEILELVQDKRIVHTWRGNDWPENQMATAYFDFEDNEEGTLLRFRLVNIPDVEPFNTIDWKAGWEMAYWKPMFKWLEERKQ